MYVSQLSCGTIAERPTVPSNLNFSISTNIVTNTLKTQLLYMQCLLPELGAAWTMALNSFLCDQYPIYSSISMKIAPLMRRSQIIVMWWARAGIMSSSSTHVMIWRINTLFLNGDISYSEFWVLTMLMIHLRGTEGFGNGLKDWRAASMELPFL